MKIRGIDIELHPDEDLSNHIRREKDFFEAEILDYIRDYHKHQDMILDIGANIGNHSVYFANFLTYTGIICFEPILANYELLKKNMSPFPIPPKGPSSVGLVNMAISDEAKMLRMSENHTNMGAGTIHSEGLTQVQATTLDRLHIQNVSLMKIDVEGHEPEVLRGAEDTIFRCHPLILIEDWYDQYAKLIPQYELEMGWPQHKTYLYKWRT